jgi:hypothetical protein
MLQRGLGLGFGSAWAKQHFPERRERNSFYVRAGYCIPPGKRGLEMLKKLGAEAEPAEILKAF